MAKASIDPPKGFFGRLKAAYSKTSQYKELRLSESCKLKGASLRVPYEGRPIELTMGGGTQKLHLYPARSVKGDELADEVEFILFDPDRFYSEISGFLRLAKGDHLILGREDELQRKIFNYPHSLAKRCISIIHDGDALLFKDLDKESASTLAPLQNAQESQRQSERRIANLREIREIFGGPIGILPPDEALADLVRINEMLEKEPLRPRNTDGMPGGVVTLPDKMIPIILGDLHAQVDNLLTCLLY